MKKIRIHRFNNEQWGRAHLPFFKTFDEYLKKYFDVEVINYNKDGNTFSGSINTKKNISTYGKNPPLSDVDCVIENLQTGDIKVLSFTEYFSNYVSHYAKSNVCSKVLLAHFNWHNVYYWMKRENAVQMVDKVKPWIFLPFEEFDYHNYRHKRDTCENLNTKMYWQGSGVDDYRQCVRFIEEDGYLQPIQPTNHDIYLENMSKSKIGMSYYQKLDRYRTPFDYPGEFCYRDIEYMSIGLPFIRIEYKDSVHDPLLPNVHYISIPRDVAHVEYEKNGERGVANLYIQRYNEVINDDVFLEYISKNQKEWFDRNILSPNREKLTFDLLGLGEWLNIPDDYVDIEELNSESILNNVNDDFVEENYLDLDKLDLNVLFNKFIEFIKSEKKQSQVSYDVTNDNKNIVGATSYKGYTLQQVDTIFDVFKKFLSKIRPSQILEIGTAGGGFTLFLKDCLEELGLNNTKIKSFDVIECSWYNELREKGLEINVINIFDHSYFNLEKKELVEDFIKQDGVTLVLCDGGYKLGEFKIFSELIKSGDFIMAHDYCENESEFEKKIYGKIWNWCEIKEQEIDEISKKYNLVHYDKEIFDNVVWVCKQKI